MVLRLDRIVTGGGDQGMTSLGDATRVRKDTPLIEALGMLDELNASIGFLARLYPDSEPLTKLQNILFDIGAYSCQPKKRPDPHFFLSIMPWLEEEIRRLLSSQEPLDRFILPGGSEGACWAHLARTIARRTERCFVRLNDERLSTTLIFLNRLSDYFFVFARFANNDGKNDVLWSPQKAV